jgi:leucyl/phenylalanyl-tRNA---protein transferase
MTIDIDDIVGAGGKLEPNVLIQAYRQGVFPWPMDGLAVIPWFCPRERAILDFQLMHIPRSLRRTLRQTTFTCTVDTQFDRVIELCGEVPRPGQDGTWITPELLAAYKELHRLGYAHSVEVWNSEQQMVGGIYGVCVEGVFSAESMFHLEPNASKIALFHLISVLQKGGGEWMDIQVMTPHMKALGAINIPRRRFLNKLARTQAKQLKPF